MSENDKLSLSQFQWISDLGYRHLVDKTRKRLKKARKFTNDGAPITPKDLGLERE